MNDLPLIVLTALVNFLITGLVGGVIVDRFKKDMDDKYNRQMEEFKTNLQNLSFEYQTKFVRNHQREVEALENLCRKYNNFVVATKSDLHKLSSIYSPYRISETSKTLLLDSFSFEPSTKELQDFVKSFDNDRLVLSNDVIAEISRIYNYSLHLITTVGVALIVDSGDGSFASVNQMIKDFELSISLIDLDKPNVLQLFYETEKGTNKQLLKLESLYKSIAGISIK